MANTIAYTSGNSLTGSLKSGVISINLNDQIIGQNYNWRNGIVFSNQYIIYSDTFTQGIDTEANAKPCAWACDYNDVALLNLINSLPPLIGQPKYDTLASAIAWLQGQNKYFIVNQNYPTIVTDSLTFLFDPGMTGSYPLTNTTIYDISGKGNTGTLVNGPVFNNSGATSYFAFDGTDDRIVVPNNSSLNFGTGPFTIIVWVSSPYNLSANRITLQKGSGGGWSDASGWKVTSGNGAGDLSWYWVVGNGSTHIEVPPSNTFSKSNDTYPMGMFAIMRNSNNTIDRFWNSVYNQNFTSLVGDVSSSGDFWIGDGYSENTIYGNIAKVLTYNKSLSLSELLQNYYMGPIVTDSLQFAVDPANVISYPGTGTVFYDMSTNKNNGTLTNGPLFYTNDGGIMYFDGADDYVSFGNPGSLTFTTNVSMSLWIKGDINEQNPSQNIYPFAKEDSYGIKVSSGTSPGVGMIVRIGGNYATCAGSNVLDGKWNHVVVTYDGQGIRSYVNGVLDSQNLSVSGSLDAGGNVSYGAWTNGYGFFNGYLSDAKIYNKVLSPTEVMQNFNAQRNRFQSNQAFANGGTVSTVIENGINYRVHTFTSSGTLTVLSAGIVEVLSVAGGGGGSGNFYDDGAGGGGGGLIYNTDYTVTTGNKTVTVGSGGVASSGGAGGNGNNSVFDNLTAIGGGGGAPHRSPGVSGGSGGGGGGSFVGDGQSNAGGSALQPGSASGGKGNRGGNGGIGDVISGGGGYPGSAGGGGAGQQGFPPTGGGTNEGGKGGDGAQISINGTPTYYAGGGGGVRNGVGGLGGGGTASYGRDGSPAGGGGVNTGGGGGGGRAFTGETGVPGPGGSGIVIVRYRI
jgi:hypothetical protein